MNKDKAMQQALEAGLESDNPYIRQLAANAVRKARVQPVQEPTPWRDMIVVTLVREGINKHRARELADHFAAQPPLPAQEPVGEVVEVNNDGFRCEFNRRLAVGTKLYTAPPLPAQRQPLTDEEIKDCLDAADQMYCERDGDKELFMARAVLAAHNTGAKQ